MAETMEMAQQIKQGHDQMQVDSNKKLATVYRELERVQTQVLAKANIEEVQRISQTLAEKSFVKSQLSTLVSRQELEAMLQSRVQKDEFQSKLKTLETDLTTVHQRVIEDLVTQFDQKLDNQIYQVKMSIQELTQYQRESFETKLQDRFTVFEKRFFDVADTSAKVKELIEKNDGLERVMKEQFDQLEEYKQNLVSLENSGLSNNQEIL